MWKRHERKIINIKKNHKVIYSDERTGMPPGIDNKKGSIRNDNA